MRFVGIDPSTRTGFVALDKEGNVLRAKELTGVGDHDPKRMVTLIDEVMRHLQPDDVICIESPAMHAQGSAIGFMWGLAHGIRMLLWRRGMPYIDVTPAAVKKFATGRGNAKKDEMVLPIWRRWGFEHTSDNVRDAFVLAQIARAVHWRKTGIYDEYVYPAHQLEVIQAILNPKLKKKRKKVNS